MTIKMNPKTKRLKLMSFIMKHDGLWVGFSFMINSFIVWKIGWFVIGHATSLAIGFEINDHLQFHCNSMYFYDMTAIKWVTWVATHATTHHRLYVCKLCNLVTIMHE
jgi:hypothetical protein